MIMSFIFIGCMICIILVLNVYESDFKSKNQKCIECIYSNYKTLNRYSVFVV